MATNVQVDSCLGEPEEIVFRITATGIGVPNSGVVSYSDWITYRHKKWRAQLEPPLEGKEEYHIRIAVENTQIKAVQWSCKIRWMVRILLTYEETGNSILWESSQFSGRLERNLSEKLMTSKELIDKGYAHNDSMFLEIRVKAEFPFSDRCLLGLKQGEFEKNKSTPWRSLLSLQCSGETCDVTIHSADGREVKAHRIVLQSFSPEFSAMFGHDMKENKEGVVQMDDINGDALTVLVKFIYASTQLGFTNWEMPELSEESLKELVNASEKYQIQALKELAAYAFLRTLNHENAFELLDFFRKYELNRLVANVCAFISAHLTN